MTTPIVEDFFTFSVPLRVGVQNNNMIIPEGQRQPAGFPGVNDPAFHTFLPPGFHTIQLLWQSEVTPIHVRIWDGTPNGRNLRVLPGGADAKTVTETFVVPPGGYRISFLQQYAVTSEQVDTPLNTLGVNFILNPAGA